MFKLRKLMFIVAGIGLLLASCTKEDVHVVDTNGIEASFRTYINEAGTRVSGTNWDTDDEIGIYALNEGEALSASSVYGGYANVQYKNGTAGATATFSPVGTSIMFPGDGTELDFVAYYPYVASVGAGYALAVDVSTQSPLSAIDLLYATASKQSKGNPTVALAFSHRMSQVVFTLTATADIDLTGVSLTLDNVLTSGSMDLATGTVTAGTVTATVTPVYDAVANTATAILLPGQEMSDIVVQIELADGTEYTWTPSAHALIANTKNTYTLNLTSGEVEFSADGSTIGDWGDGNASPSEDLDPNAPTPVAPGVEVSAPNIVAGGGTTTLEITAPEGTEWTAESDVDWITLGVPISATRSTQTFTGSADIEVTVEPNTGTEERTGTITVTIAGGAEPLTAIITQAGVDAPAPVFSTDVTSLEFVAAGEAKNVVLTSNVEWTATISDGDEEWLTVSPSSGTEGGTIVVTTSENNVTSERTATVTLSAAGVDNIVIAVSQAAAEEEPEPTSTLLFPGGDFEDWTAFEAVKVENRTYVIGPVEGGRTGNALHLDGNVTKNETAFGINVSAPGNPLFGKSKIVFYMKGTSTGKSLSFNVYADSANQGYHNYNLGTVSSGSGVVSVEKSGSNDYTGSINTGGEWVRVEFNIEGISDFEEDIGELMFAVRTGRDATYDILLDDFTIE